MIELIVLVDNFMHFIPVQGQKMKEALVASGSLTQCEVVASQLARSSVVDTTKEKPVTKKMLKEVYHWDEYLDGKIRMLTCLHEEGI